MIIYLVNGFQCNEQYSALNGFYLHYPSFQLELYALMYIDEDIEIPVVKIFAEIDSTNELKFKYTVRHVFL